MNSVPDILVREFHSDIYNVCSKVTEAGCEDDLQPLQEYLLRGRGWVILHVLNTLGLQVCYHISNNNICDATCQNQALLAI